MIFLLVAAPAFATCTFAQTTYADAVEVLLTAGPGEVPCRTVGFTADVPLTVEATLETTVGRKRKLRGDDLRTLPGGGWEVRVPTLAAGDRIVARLSVPAPGLQVALGGAPPPRYPDARRERTVRMVVDERHPGWGFADPAFATTEVLDVWHFGEDAPAQVLPAPGRTGPGGAARGATADLPDAVGWGGGAGEARVQWSAAGAAAQGNERIPPGVFVLDGPPLRWVTSASGGVTVTRTDRGVRFDAPTGGRVRWRVESSGGEPVIPDVATFVAGLDWRFARASLPEPALPPRAKLGVADAEIPGLVLDAVRAKIDYRYAEADPLRPRPLNRAWQSGWLSPVERGLVLHRLLLQERVDAGWVLTGEAPDPATFTGYDDLLVLARTPQGEVWLDPGCRACAPGEVRPTLQGQPALGAADRIPRQPGLLVRRMRLQEASFLVRFEATGAAALWLREQVAHLDLPRRGDRLATALGVEDGVLVGHSASLLPGPGERPLADAELLDAPDGTVVIELRTTRNPQPPAGDAPPWDGGWRDEL